MTRIFIAEDTSVFIYVSRSSSTSPSTMDSSQMSLSLWEVEGEEAVGGGDVGGKARRCCDDKVAREIGMKLELRPENREEVSVRIILTSKFNTESDFRELCQVKATRY